MPATTATQTNARQLDSFPSSAFFDAINDAFEASEADKKEAMRQGNAIFAFTLKSESGQTESWHIDLKTSGRASKGLGESPTGASRGRYSAVYNPANKATRTCSDALAIGRGLREAC